MKSIRWRLFVPALQAAVAVTLFVMAEYQYRAHVPFLPGYRPMEKGWLIGLNGPARLIAYMFELLGNVTVYRGSMMWIEMSDIVFLGGVVGFWYLVGRDIDQVLGTVGELTSGLALLINALLAIASLLFACISVWDIAQHRGSITIECGWTIVLACYAACRFRCSAKT